jgi:hypothetical protein
VLSYSIHALAVVVTIHRWFTSAPTLQFAGKSAGKFTCKIATDENRAAKQAIQAKQGKQVNLAELPAAKNSVPS